MPDAIEKLLSQVSPQQVHYNLSVPELVEKALARGEGILTATGALRVTTGKYTGRSPNDKFIVDTPGVHEDIWWQANRPFSDEAYERLRARLLAYLQNREFFVFDGFVGAAPQYRLPVRIITEMAWQNLFAHQLFLRPTPEDLANHRPQVTIMAVPGFQADPEIDGTNSEACIVLHLDNKEILIGGTYYAGEIKKSVFTLMNYLLPARGIFPMHCSANTGSDGDVALFFGLSGTGKTSLSADPQRFLIGDDEHGWSDDGVFNLEGGCYAKCIRLSQENEPQIWASIRFGSVLENVVIDPVTRELDFASDAITENTRAAYPVDFIPGAVIPGVGGIPTTIIFLTADAFGVLPPIARLTPEQAMYHFLSGYTSKLAGTERGITEPQATFSTCFGAPFLPRSPVVYAQMLREKINKYQVRVFLVNTGWSGGPYGTGQRIPIKYTRAMITAALKGELDQVVSTVDPVFHLPVPVSCPGVPEAILHPRQTWSDGKVYDRQAEQLAQMFVVNFQQFSGIGIDSDVLAANPR